MAWATRPSIVERTSQASHPRCSLFSTCKKESLARKSFERQPASHCRVCGSSVGPALRAKEDGMAGRRLHVQFAGLHQTHPSAKGDARLGPIRSSTSRLTVHPRSDLAIDAHCGAPELMSSSHAVVCQHQRARLLGDVIRSLGSGCSKQSRCARGLPRSLEKDEGCLDRSKRRVLFWENYRKGLK